MKVWLDNTPFKSNNSQIKKDTFYAIINAVMALKQNEIDNLCGDGGLLNDKLSLTLSKYIFKSFDIISNKDPQLIAVVQNGQHLLKVQLKLKEKMGNACILKCQFEKHPICWI
mgnify:CR=1 FL=1